MNSFRLGSCLTHMRTLGHVTAYCLEEIAFTLYDRRLCSVNGLRADSEARPTCIHATH